MADLDQKTDALVQEGLRLYGAGDLEGAIERWRAALRISPEHPRARQHLKYVEDNRAALEESFRARAKGSSGRHATILGIADPSCFEPASQRTPVSAGQGSRTTGACGDGQHRGAAAGPAERRIGSEEAGGEDSGYFPAETTPWSRVTLVGQPPPPPPSAAAASGARQPPFRVLNGGGAACVDGGSAGDAFDPAEETPVGTVIPEPVRLVGDTAARRGDVSQRVSGAPPPPELSWEADEHQPPLASGARLEEANSPSPWDREAYIDLADFEVQTPSPPAMAGTPLEQAAALRRSGALKQAREAYREIAVREPHSQAAREALQEVESDLLAHFREALRSLGDVPVVLIPQHEVVMQGLDHRAGFILSRIDGLLAIEDILDVSGMDRLEASSILVQLMNRGVIGAKP